jgi:hypothetical protein
MSASTLKGGMSAAKEGSQLGFNRAGGGAQSRNARALPSSPAPFQGIARRSTQGAPAEQNKVLI